MSNPNRTSFSSLSSHPLSPDLCRKHILVPNHHTPSAIFINVSSFVGHLLISPLRVFPSLSEANPPGRLAPAGGNGWGKKRRESPSESQSAINLPIRHSVYPLLLSFIISSSVSALYLCPSAPTLPPPFSRSHFYPVFSQGWTCCDGSPLSSAPSSQTNITLLSVLYLLLLCLDRISTRVLDHCIPPLSVFQGPSFL